MRSKPNKLSKLIQITKVPIRILCKAKDSYVRGMLDFASSGRIGCGSVGGGAARLPKSFSVNSSREIDEEEFRQLLRLLSKKESEVGYCSNSNHCSMDYSGLRKSYSVGLGKIGRIDEDRACSFREDVDANVYPRSKSHAIRRKIVYY